MTQDEILAALRAEAAPCCRKMIVALSAEVGGLRSAARKAARARNNTGSSGYHLSEIATCRARLESAKAVAVDHLANEHAEAVA